MKNNIGLFIQHHILKEKIYIMILQNGKDGKQEQKL